MSQYRSLLVIISTATATLCAPMLGETLAAPSPRTASYGTVSDLGAVLSGASVVIPTDDAEAPIVGMAVNTYQNQIITWYANGKFSIGSPTNLEQYGAPTPYSVGDDLNPWDILAMAIDSQGHVWTWYATGVVTEGQPWDLDLYDRGGFSAPTDHDYHALVGVAMSKNDDTVYSYYADGTYAAGTPKFLGQIDNDLSYALPNNRKTGHVIGVALDSYNVARAWYHDVENGFGHASFVDEVDARAMDIVRRYRLPGLSIAASKDGRVVLKKGYGFSDFENQIRMTEHRRCRIGSVSKVITALTAMHLEENDPNFDVTMPVYGSSGALSGQTYINSQATGVARHQPIVAKAIAPNGHVYTWYHDRTVTSGTSTNPDLFWGPVTYKVPDGLKPEDIRTIAIDETGRTWTWYEDKTYSAGSATDLSSREARDKKVKIPGDLGMKNVLGAAFAANGNVYAYYDDGTRSTGSPSNFASVGPRKNYSTGPQDRYDMVGIGIAKSGNKKAYAFYSDGVVTHGSSLDLRKTGTSNYLIPGYAYDFSKNWYGWYQAMNVDHLMSHSSGLTHSGDISSAGTMFYPTVADPAPILSYRQVHEYMLRTRKLKFEPGSSNDYSNHGMGLLSHIVSQVAGMDFYAYALQNIVDPLGLNMRSNSEQETSSDTRRHRYGSNDELETFDGDPNHNLGLGAGGWKSSATDLVRLMLATDQLPNRPDILLPSTISKMETKPYAIPDGDYTRGWFTASGILSHGGATGGGRAKIMKFGAPGVDPYGGTPITIALCTPIGVSGKDASTMLDSLGYELRGIIRDANIPSSYDLY